MSVICVLWIAGCTSLPNRQPPSELGVTQIQGKEEHPDEYVFCDMKGGAWGCKSVTPKTWIAEVQSLESADGAITAAVKGALKGAAPASKVDVAVQSGGAATVSGTQPGTASSYESTSSNLSQIAIVSFDFDSSLLTADSKVVLLDVLQKLNGETVLLRGYTDSVGPSEYNDWLALRRANRVKEFLKNAQANAGRIDVEGRGLCCYVDSNETDKQRARNRRVEIYTVD